MSQSTPVVLTIAGFDPSSGAGVTADIKTIAAHGCYGLACITALTVQSTQGVSRVEGVSPRLIADTLETLAADFEIAAVHLGMLGNAAAAQAIVEFQKKRKLPLVLDPVLKASSGARLLDDAGQQALIHELMPLATVTTPNADEAAALTGLSVTNHLEMKAAAIKLHEMDAASVVVTGGHLQPAVDLLSFQLNGKLEQAEFRADHQSSRSTHGTGCAFSTALACNLALGKTLAEAVMLAKAYVTVAIAHGQDLGRGIGPVHHLYRLDEVNLEKGKSRPKTV